jgi:hypothetical protein
MTATYEQARDRAQRLRLMDHGREADELMRESYRELDFHVLSYDTWSDFCAVVGHRPLLRTEDRHAAIRNIDEWKDERGVGLSRRAQADKIEVAPSLISKVLLDDELPPLPEGWDAIPEVELVVKSDGNTQMAHKIRETPEVRDAARRYRSEHVVNSRQLHRLFRHAGLKVATSEDICREARATESARAATRPKTPAAPVVRSRPTAVPNPKPEPKSRKSYDIPIYERSEAIHAIKSLLAESRRGGYTNLLAADVEAALEAEDHAWLRKQRELFHEFAVYAARIDRLLDDDALRERLRRNTNEREDMGTLQPLELRVVSA